MSLVLKGREKERVEFNLALFVVATLSYNLITLAVNLFVGFFLEFLNSVADCSVHTKPRAVYATNTLSVDLD